MPENPEYFAEKLQDYNIINIHSLLEEILLDNDPNAMENLWKHVISGNRWGKILFIKLLKDKKEANIIGPIRFFLEENDPLLNILAVDLLSSINVSGRVDLFFDLLKHPVEEIKIAAIHFFSEEKSVSSIPYLKRMSKESSISDIVKKEIKNAIENIIRKSPLSSLNKEKGR